MDKYRMDRIWEAQGELSADPQYAELLKEYRIKNAALLDQLETMTALQQNSVMDYLGVLTELHLKMLIHAIGKDT